MNQSFASIKDNPQSLMLIINLYSYRVHHTRHSIECFENDVAPSSVSLYATYTRTYTRTHTARSTARQQDVHGMTQNCYRI